MAKLVLLLVFVCFQVSLQEEQGNTENGIIDEVIPTPDVEILDGADENQWQYEKENEDDEWLEALEDLLEEIDDYSDENSEEFNELLDAVDKYFDEKYSGENEDNEFEDDDKWFGEDEEEDDDDDDDYDADDVYDHKPWGLNFPKFPYPINKKPFNFGGNGKGALDLYYSWLLRMQMLNTNKKSPISKRFSSV